MKRPIAVYLMAGFYLLLILVEVGMIFQFRTDIPVEGRRFTSPWSGTVDRSTDQLILALTALPMAVSLVGLWRGRSWGRNLALLFSGLVACFMFLAMLGIFTLFKESDIAGINRWYFLMKFIGLLIFSFVFYLGLRPEVGEFCGIYPREQLKS